jgi:hypothetical protein
MGRKHNDVFVLGSEALPDELRDEKTAEPAARAGPEPGATAGGHGGGAAAGRPKLPRAFRALLASVALGALALTATRLLLVASSGEGPEGTPASSAAQIAQVEPISPEARPASIAVPPRPRRGAGPRTGPEHHLRARRSSQSPSEVPPQPVAPAAAVATPTPIYPTSEVFGFER